MITKLKYILTFIILITTGMSFAQVEKDSTRFKIDLALTGNVQTGNFERLQFINNLDVSIDSKDHKWNVLSRHLYLYQKVFGNKSQDDYLTRNFVTYRLDKKWDIFGAFFYEKFFIKRIDHNIQFGAGTRYAIVKTDRAMLQLGLMGSYANKEYVGSNFQDFNNNGDDSIDGFFVSPVLNSRFVIIPKRVIFNLLFWYQQDVGESQNYRFNLETSVIVPLYKGLSMKVAFNDFYENINLVGAKANDTFLTYGLTYKFKK